MIVSNFDVVVAGISSISSLLLAFSETSFHIFWVELFLSNLNMD